MAADLHIHIAEGITEQEYALFCSHHLGSKHFSFAMSRMADRYKRDDKSLFEIVSDTPSVWVGEVSWLKAALTEDDETFVPDVVGTISGLIGEDWPVLDDELLSKIAGAFEQPNKTSYGVDDGVRVMDFLREHKGKRVFTVSW